MCGIAGIIAASPESMPSLADRVGRMCQVMHPRGPDDTGVEIVHPCVGFGNRRLAIQDVSAAGHMPMSSHQGRVWITYNGEIYNATELRNELRTLGLMCRTRTDTEVILLGFEAWGESVVGRLRGMFALAIYDGRRSPSVFLARDPLGIKPLYYTASRDGLAFASECRPLLASRAATREIDPAGLVAFLQLGSVPAPLTIYRDIRSLEAGQTLTLQLGPQGWSAPSVHQYWTIPRPDRAASLRRGEAVEAVREVLLDSVRRHLVSDVPLGAFLSGGIDSGSVVALMRRANPTGAIRTCSVVFAEPAYNEAPLARDVARQFETEHAEILVTADDVRTELDRIVSSLDQPSNDGLNTFFVSRAARERSLTVALSGLGGDELFGGYPSFARLPVLMRGARAASVMPGAVPRLARLLELRGPHWPGARLAGWLRAGAADPAALYLGLRGLFSHRALDALVRPEVRRAPAHDSRGLLDLVRAASGTTSDLSPGELASRFELTAYMRHQLLRDTDVMSMAHSLEVRVPFVDHVVVEAVLGMQPFTISGPLTKQVLRDAVPELPPAVRLRRDKQGFAFPFQAWMRGPLRGELGDLIEAASRHLDAYLQPGAAQRVLWDFDAGRLHWSRVWALASLCTTLPPASDEQTTARREPAAVS